MFTAVQAEELQRWAMLETRGAKGLTVRPWTPTRGVWTSTSLSLQYQNIAIHGTSARWPDKALLRPMEALLTRREGSTLSN